MINFMIYFQHIPSNPQRMGLNKFMELKLAWFGLTN